MRLGSLNQDMLLSIVGGVAVALLAHGVSSTTVPRRRQVATEKCEAHLLIDDFSTWLDGENTVMGATSDDATLNATSIDSGILAFTPSSQSVSYIYEQFTCVDADALGYDSISFTIKGPQAASVSLELQTQADCSATEYKSYYYTIDGLSGSLQTVNIPLSNWANATLKGVVGFVWYGFSAGRTGLDLVWQLDNFQLLCSGVAPPGDPPAITEPVPTTTPTVTPAPKSSPLDPWGEDKQGEKQAIALRAAAAAADTGDGSKDAACETTLIDDWASQSRLTFLYYNSQLKPTSDDGTMKSVVVVNNKVTLTPLDTDSYFYSQIGCFDARAYGGISLRITAAAGTTFSVQLSSSIDSSCNGDSTKDVVVTSKSLGWTFNGKEQLYSIPFSKFSGVDYSKFTMIFLSGLSKAVTLGP
ncbi:hypothetical protein E0Z10_g2076, partial [Xylaria hypoxylon]